MRTLLHPSRLPNSMTLLHLRLLEVRVGDENVGSITSTCPSRMQALHIPYTPGCHENRSTVDERTDSLATVHSSQKGTLSAQMLSRPLNSRTSVNWPIPIGFKVHITGKHIDIRHFLMIRDWCLFEISWVSECKELRQMPIRFRQK